MKVQPFWIVFSGAMLAALLATALGSDGVINDDHMLWQVRYHKGQPSETTKDIAIRLQVKQVNGKPQATLWRYDKVDSSGKKYEQRKGKSGKVEQINGKITTPGNGKKRERQKFEFTKEYQGDTEMRVLTIRGFFHGSKDRKSNSDDSICVRIFDKPMADRTTRDVCDELPPDEDNLTEEPVDPDPPVYDADDPC